MKDFYNEEELMSMPLKIVRGLDTETQQQEQLVQKVVNMRMAVMPTNQPIYRKDVPDIQTQADEKEWQHIIDQRTAKLKPSLMEFQNPSTDSPGMDEREANKRARAAVKKAERGMDLAKEDGKGKPITLKGGVSSSLTTK